MKQDIEYAVPLFKAGAECALTAYGTNRVT